VLKLASLAGVSWLTPVGELLARAAEEEGPDHRPHSLIFLWMQGGPSQLETFDPHPGRKIAGGTQAIATAAPGVQLAAGLPRVAEQLESISLIRNLVSSEADHERGTYALKTGYSPIPTGVHPSIGAILCHQLPDLQVQIPRHVTILPNQWSGRGGFLGDQFDAFKVYDPASPVPDVQASVDEERLRRRVEDLDVIERAFARRRAQRATATLHRQTLEAALQLMSSEQLAAFAVQDEPEPLRKLYGDTPFGRGCLAARRLVERGVRCVEVTLEGWDTHANNHNGCETQNAALDPAFAALVYDLKSRGLLDRTIVLCGGEFGRTPDVNGLLGRDHWPSGFSYAIAGGGFRGGLALGETDPDGAPLTKDQGRPIGDLHATVLSAMGIDIRHENIAPGPRPIKISEGQPIAELMPG
jgi:hypothetical protein